MSGIQSIGITYVSLTESAQSNQQTRWQQMLDKVAQTLGIDPQKLASAINQARQDQDGDQDGSQTSTSGTNNRWQSILNQVAQQLGLQPDALMKAFQNAMQSVGSHHHHQQASQNSTGATQLSLTILMINESTQSQDTSPTGASDQSTGSTINVAA